MSYCTQADLIARFGETELIQLTNKTNFTAGVTPVVNVAALALVLADADAMIDSYLNTYLPLTTIPPNLVRIACVIVRFMLYSNLVPDSVKEEYKEAKAFLTLVSQGKLSLAPDSTGVIAVQVDNLVQFDNGGSVFGRRDY